MALCVLIAGAVALHLTGPEVRLEWTHSVEKIRWREVWAETTTGLTLRRAAVKGSGAGMEPGDTAILTDGWWEWSPALRVPALHLAASGSTVSGWDFCDLTGCHQLGATASAPLTLAPCAATGSGQSP